MSHFCVAVFSDTPDDASFDRLLAPYNENDNFTRHVIPFGIIRAKYKTFLEQNPAWKEHGFKYYLKQMGYKIEDNQVIKYYNDNAKWDYYTLDGKDYLYELKPRVVLDWLIPQELESERHRKNDYDYSYKEDNDEYGEEWNSAFWDWYVDGKPWAFYDTPEPDPFYSREYYTTKYGTKEIYMKDAMSTAPFAFVTPDGVWHEPGTMGWFAVDNSTPEGMNRYIDEWNEFIASKSNPYVSFVDCHI